jgi:16S rRNA pseudouridine516 synthase
MPRTLATFRIDRVLANLGYASRSEAKILLRQGRVRHMGIVIKNPDCQVIPAEITLDGEALERPGGILVMVNKPLDVVCSHDVREGTRIFDFLPPRWLKRNPQVISAGRLDKDSTGLLLITDDHVLVHRVTSPRHHVTKRYEVQVNGPILPSTVERFESGELLIDGDPIPCRTAPIRLLDDNRAEVTLTEGRNRQLRRMFAACGMHVEALHRVAFGALELGDLAEGTWIDVVGPVE